MSAADRPKQIFETRIAILDGSGVGEPMVPPRAPSFGAAHGSLAVGLPPGEARLRPRRHSSRVTGLAVER